VWSVWFGHEHGLGVLALGVGVGRLELQGLLVASRAAEGLPWARQDVAGELAGAGGVGVALQKLLGDGRGLGNTLEEQGAPGFLVEAGEVSGSASSGGRSLMGSVSRVVVGWGLTPCPPLPSGRGGTAGAA